MSRSTKDSPLGIFHEQARDTNYTTCIRMEDPHSPKLPEITFAGNLTSFVLGGLWEGSGHASGKHEL